MVDKPIDRQQRLAKFLHAVESAQKLQDDILKYGLGAAKLYCEDVYGDWLLDWGEGENRFLESMIDFLESRKIKPVIDKVYPLEQINEAVARMEQGDQFGKIVLQIS